MLSQSDRPAKKMERSSLQKYLLAPDDGDCTLLLGLSALDALATDFDGRLCGDAEDVAAPAAAAVGIRPAPSTAVPSGLYILAVSEVTAQPAQLAADPAATIPELARPP